MHPCQCHPTQEGLPQQSVQFSTNHHRASSVAQVACKEAEAVAQLHMRYLPLKRPASYLAAVESQEFPPAGAMTHTLVALAEQWMAVHPHQTRYAQQLWSTRQVHPQGYFL